MVVWGLNKVKEKVSCKSEFRIRGYNLEFCYIFPGIRTLNGMLGNIKIIFLGMILKCNFRLQIKLENL